MGDEFAFLTFSNKDEQKLESDWIYFLGHKSAES